MFNELSRSLECVFHRSIAYCSSASTRAWGVALVMSTVDGVIVGGFAMLMLGDPTLRYIGFSSLCICSCASFIWLVILGIMTLTAVALMFLKVAHPIEKAATYLMTIARRGCLWNLHMCSVRITLAAIKHAENYYRRPRLLPVIAVAVLFLDDNARINCSMLVTSMYMRGWHSSAGCPLLSTSAAMYLAWDSVPVCTLPVIMSIEYRWPTFAGLFLLSC